MRPLSTLLTPCLVSALFAVSCAAFGIRSSSETAQAALRATYTLHDFEIARSASASNLARLEGFQELDPDDDELLILLARAWALHAELFLVDGYERALVVGDASDADYQRQRVIAGFTRARYWAVTWLGRKVPALDTGAMTESSLQKAVEENFTSSDDAAALLVLGHAFLGPSLLPTDSESHKPGAGAPPDAKLAAIFLERSVHLAEDAEFGSALGLLGSYQAALGDSAGARQSFQRGELLAKGKYLLTPLRAAVSLHCREHDRSAFESELNEILKANDPAPEVRLHNIVAKRRASRWLVDEVLAKRCGF
jgi:TRAP transporter T-component